MNEVMMEEEFTKKFICERDIYLQLKSDQKALVQEYHSGELGRAFDLQMKVWWDSRHEGMPLKRTLLGREPYREDRPSWRLEKPSTPWIIFLASLKETRRAMNIVYGIVKGKTYFQIEQKVRENNEVPTSAIIVCSEHYGIDPKLILGAIHG